MTESFSFPRHNEKARLRAGDRGTPGVYLAGCFLNIYRLQLRDSQVLCKSGCKGGMGDGVAPELFTTYTLWIHLTISPSHRRGQPTGPQKNPKPVSRHSQGSVCKTTTTTKSIYKQEFCPAYSANDPWYTHTSTGAEATPRNSPFQVILLLPRRPEVVPGLATRGQTCSFASPV